VVPELAIRDYAARSEAAARGIPATLLDNANQQGSVRVLVSGAQVADSKIRDYFRRKGEAAGGGTTYWKFRQANYVTATATAIDKQDYFVNSYLVGFQPFAVDALWQPFYIVATRKRYLLDSTQYGLDDIWQNSAQSYLNTRGDCEDHALLLADWLIGLGVDARVVLGTYQGAGHAWVVALHDGETFLLEATSKRRYRNWNAYPLAGVSAGYRPTAMFNRSGFWVNSGNPNSRDYSGSHWQRVSNFSRERSGATL